MAVATAAAEKAKEKKAKPEVAPDSVIAAAYEKAAKVTENLELTIIGLRRTLNEEASAISESAELRRRAQDVADYDAEVARQKVLDEQEREDRERHVAYTTRFSALREGEDELLGLLGVRRDSEGKVPTAKILRTAFEAHVAEATKAGEGKGKGMAEREYLTAKKIDAAEAEKTTALIKQENEYLKKRNEVLEKQNAELLADANKNLDRMKDLAARGLDASAGIQGKATESLQTAATAGANKPSR